MAKKNQKSRGFTGELIIDIPEVAIGQCLKMPLISSLYITKMGFYPRALHHYYHRPNGIAQVIVLYCTDGAGWVQFKKNKLTIKAGEICLIPAGLPHSYGADAVSPWTIYWLHLNGASCNEVVEAIANVGDKDVGKVHVGFVEKRNYVFEQIADTFKKGYSTSNLLFANLLLLQYVSTFIFPDYFNTEPSYAQDAGPTDRAILFMQQHLSQALTLDNIARSAHLSVSFFSRKFKHDTGYAPIEYFNHLRIQKACQLLHFTKYRVSEIANEIGIEDPFYFSRLFKQQMGMSPAAYRGK
jgi:AraC-like DNA-binding protein